jgi:hypothetical protein
MTNEDVKALEDVQKAAALDRNRFVGGRKEISEG